MEPPDRKGPESRNGHLPAPPVPAAPIGTGPVPEGARPAEQTFIEVEGLLITLLPGGGLALVDSHPDGATSVISLGRRRLEALAPLLRAEEPGEGDEGPGPAVEASEASQPGAGVALHDRLEDRPEHAPEHTREDTPEHEPDPAPADARGAAPAAGSPAAPEDGPVESATTADGQDGAPDVDWDLYDEQLKAAFLLEQYASGVAPEDLPRGWQAVLEALPAVLTRRSRRTRASGPRDTGGPAPGGSHQDG